MPEARSRYGRLGTNESMAQTAMPRISMRNNVSRTVLPIWEMSDVFAVSVIRRGLVVGGEWLFHADGGAAAADVAGQGKEFLDVNQFGAFVAGDAGGFLEVDLAVAPDHADEMTVAVAAQDDGLVDAGDVLSESGCHGIGGEMLLVHFVGYQLIGYSGPVQKAGCVGFL